MISNLLQKIKPSPTIAMSNKAKELKASGIDVVDFSVGEPDFNTPKHICDAATEAMRLGHTKYTMVDGTLDLKNAICEKLKRENELEYKPNEISVSTGAKQAIFNAFAASINPGDEVIIPSPSWVSYIDIVKMFDGVPVDIKTTMDKGFILSGNKLEAAITSKTKWLILNSPSNPTGVIYKKEHFEDLARVLRKFPQVNIMCDDIYEHMIFDGEKFYTLLNIVPDLASRVMIINGVSKAYSMTGFRIGYAACKNLELINAMRTIQSQSTSSPSAIGQYAAAFALRSPESMKFILEMRSEMQARRDFVFKRLSEISGIKTIKGQGAFYAFSSIESLIGKKTKSGAIINSGNDFCEKLLEEKFVATVSGEAFGVPDHFRLSFSTDMKTIERGLGAIEGFVKDLV